MNGWSGLGARPVARYITPRYLRTAIKERHDQLRKAERCINGPLVGDVSQRTGRVHGKAVRSGRCANCLIAMGRTVEPTRNSPRSSERTTSSANP